MARKFKAGEITLSRLQLSASSALSPFAMVVVAPLLPELRRVFDAGEGEVQFVISAYLIGLALAQLVLGPISDRFGRRPVVIISLVIYSLVSLVCAMAPTLGILIAARFVQACAAAGTAAICRASVHDVHRGDAAAYYLAYIAAATSMAHTLAPMVGGFLDVFIDWRGLFLVLTVIGLLMAAYTARTMPETRQHPEGGSRFSLGHVLLNNFRMLRVPLFQCYAAMYAFTGAGYYAFLAVAPAYFADHFGIGGAAFGLNWSLMAVAFLVGAITSARLIKLWGRGRVMTLGLMVQAVIGILHPLILLQWGATPTTLIAPFVVLSLLNGIVSPPILSAAIGVHSSLAGTASGLSGALAMGSAAVVTSLAAVFYNGTGISLILPMTVTMIAMGVLRGVSLAIERRQRAVE